MKKPNPFAAQAAMQDSATVSMPTPVKKGKKLVPTGKKFPKKKKAGGSQFSRFSKVFD